MFVERYPLWERTHKENRFIVHLNLNNTRYYLDVTDDLAKHGIYYKDFGSKQSMMKLESACPTHIESSFNEPSFKISKKSLEEWINNLKK